MFSAGYSLTYLNINSVFPLVVLSVGNAITIGTAQKWLPENRKGKGREKMAKLKAEFNLLLRPNYFLKILKV